jgi:hypothetical protein
VILQTPLFLLAGFVKIKTEADRLIKSSDTQIGTPIYDDHGNILSLAGAGASIAFTYDALDNDALDNNVRIVQGQNKVEYLKASDGSVLRKKEYLNNVLTKSYRYIAGGSIMQTCSLTNDNSCTTTDYSDPPILHNQ